MSEEVHRIKAVLDITELQSQLAQARSEINSTMSDALQSSGPSLGDSMSSIAGGAVSLGRSIQDYTSMALQSLGAFGSQAAYGIRDVLPDVRSGDHVRYVSGESRSEFHFRGEWEIDRMVHNQRLAGRRSFIEGRMLGSEMAETGAGLALGTIGFAAGMAIPIPGVNWAAAFALGGIGDSVGRGIMRPVTNLLTDGDSWRQHFQMRDSIESSVALGIGSQGRGPGGLLAPGISSQVAIAGARRAYESKFLTANDVSTIAEMAGGAGLLNGFSAGATSDAQVGDALTKRLEELEGRVVRLRRTLGTDTAGAMGALTSGIMMGLSEQQAEAQLLQTPTLASSVGLNRGMAMGLMQQGSTLFSGAGMYGASGVHAAQGAMLHARQLVDSGGISREMAIRMGGVEGITGFMTAQTAGLLSSDFGGAMALAEQANPGAMSDFLHGRVSSNEIQAMGRGSLAGKTKLEQMVARDEAAQSLSGLPLEVVTGLNDRHLGNQFQKQNPGAKVTAKSVKAWLRYSKGMPEGAADVQSASIVNVHENPDHLEDMIQASVKAREGRLGAQQAEADRVQIRHKQRREFMDNLPGRGALKALREGFVGKPGDEVNQEAADGKSRETYDADIAKIESSNLTDDERVSAYDAALDRHRGRRKENEKENSNWAGTIMSAVKDITGFSHAYEQALSVASSTFAPDSWNAWARQKKLGGPSDKADEAIKADTEARAMEASSQSGLSGTNQILMQILTTLQSMQGQAR